MYRERDDQAVGFGVGILTGAVVGAGLALLFAPKAGAALRADLGESVGDVRDAIAQRYQDLAARAGVELDTLQERVERMSASVEADARDFVSSVRRKTAANDNPVQS
jgi:gas vesicle protein